MRQPVPSPQAASSDAALRLDDFDYELPPALIAQAPLAQREASRLLVVADSLEDWEVAALPRILRPGDLLVFNDTRVVPARVQCRKPSGGRVELLLERVRDAHTGLFQVRSNKPLRPGQALCLGAARGELLAREAGFWIVRFDTPLRELLRAHGEVPLPPYIKRPAAAADGERYQTVYARREGAVAAPTAGLHFSAALLAQLRAHGVDTAFLTLHVGAGTFAPVRSENLSHHRMHAEHLEIDAALCQRIACQREAGRRVIAVGTTVVRALETAWHGDRLAPYSGETELFITPGYRFRAVDALLTNFHLPRSTLLMLVCAFGGHTRVMRAYRHAVASGYRFFSYGDAMFVTPPAPADAVRA